MPLLTQELRNKLPELYSQEHTPDPQVVCRFFHPLTQFAWYVTEGSPVDENGYYDTDKEKVDFLFFGLVDGLEAELGYFYLSELESVTIAGMHIERDTTFEPAPLSVIRARL